MYSISIVDPRTITGKENLYILTPLIDYEI